MKIKYITLLGEKYPLCFSLSATEEICDEFGSLDEMSKALSGEKTSKQIKAISKVIEILLKAGRNYCKVAGIEMPPPLECRPGDLIDIGDKTAIEAIFATIGGDSERTIETTQKNVKPTQE